jgi:hypothetical protein
VKIWLLLTLKITKMKVRFLPFLMLPMLGMAQGNSNGEKPTGELLSNEISPNEIKRNASFNLDEIKVRWKKAALENCPGVPCVSITPPGPVSNIVATVTSPTSVRVTFGEPASNGGSPITGYEATATPTSSAPAKRKSSATITIKGDKSPIDIPGLTTGQNYIFTVVALNAAGGSTPTVTVTPVTPCTLNTAVTQTLEIYWNMPINIQEPVSIATTTGATGIGAATGLPPGVTATWSDNSIKISGTPTAASTFNYTIPLTGGCGSVEAKGTIVVGAAPPPTCELPVNNPTIILSGSQLPLDFEIGITPPGVTSIEYIEGLPIGTTLEWKLSKLILKGQTSVEFKSYTFYYFLKGGACDNELAKGDIILTTP